MFLPSWLTKSCIAAVLVFAPLSSNALFVSINLAPPPLPVYEQPLCPYDGYLWTPGYWAYGDYGYYWVPGVWVPPPSFGLLWTPGYWGWGGGGYFFHTGYWGPHVGFYGGINYGFGYGGRGYDGGRWNNGHFFYNSAVNRVNVTNIHNTYVDRSSINNVNARRVSFNGGNGGVQAQPSTQDRQFAHERHVQPTSVQQSHVRAASEDRSQFAKFNGGKPGTLVADRAEAYKSVAQQHAATQPLSREAKVNASSAGSQAVHRDDKGAAGENHPMHEAAVHQPAVHEGATHEGMTHEAVNHPSHVSGNQPHDKSAGGPRTNGSPHPHEGPRPQGHAGGQQGHGGGPQGKDKKH